MGEADIGRVLVGNPRCEKCGQHHPVTFDCTVRIDISGAELRRTPTPDHPCRMNDAELRAEIATWETHCATATGFPSAYFAAKQLEVAVSEANRRGWGVVNKYPITIGGSNA